jgi:hypothetical protein
MEAQKIRKMGSLISKLDREKCYNILSQEYHSEDREMIALFLEHYVCLFVSEKQLSVSNFIEVNTHWKKIISPMKNKISTSLILTRSQKEKLQLLFSHKLSDEILEKLNSELELSRYRFNTYKKPKVHAGGSLTNTVHTSFVPFVDIETKL